MIIWVFMLKTRDERGGGLPKGGGVGWLIVFVGGDRVPQGCGHPFRVRGTGRRLGSPGRVLGAHGCVLGVHGRVVNSDGRVSLALVVVPLVLTVASFALLMLLLPQMDAASGHKGTHGRSLRAAFRWFPDFRNLPSIAAKSVCR